MSFLMQDYNHAASLVGDRWKKLDGAKIFLTGGTGFFGAWLLNTLLVAQKSYDFKCRISVLSRHPENFLSKFPHFKSENTLSFVQGDVRDFIFPEGEFSHIIHGAVDVAPSLSGQKIETFDVIYKGTQHILDFCEDKKTSSVLFVSSGAVYGKHPAFIQEDAVFSHQGVVPTSLYAEGKRISEWMFLNANLPAKIKIARCFAFMGPHLSLQAPLAVSYFFRQILRSQDIVLNSDGSSLRSYMYGSDLAAWLWSLLLTDSNEKIFNVGSADAVSILELANKIIAASGKKVSVQIKNSGAGDQYVPSVQRAEKELNLKVTVPLDSAIERSWHFWKENM